ncbi:MAG: hypothetical protein KAT15_16215 [Bacteroidales bacterium]|nr:hypothetical protein [Bacteroidales bacterium]
MKIKHTILILVMLVLVLNKPVSGQDHHERYATLDVLNYRFEIDLNDSTDVIRCKAEVAVLFKSELDRFYLDLTSVDGTGTGMKIEEVMENGLEIPFVHSDNRVTLAIPPAEAGETRIFRIQYHGIPSDGLIISKNKFGDRTFFGDNWPNRAHHWLPTVDHPSDKAMVEFLVYAPEHYGIVSNGTNMCVVRENGRVTSHWKTIVPLPTKLMVIGVSPFAVQELESSSGIPVSTWVYPQNRAAGFYDYSIATYPLDFFESYIAPYPFSKLANVQSKTVYGGMENASCIFYSERTVTGNRDLEVLFAHEIAHQWFGDAVSEMDWHHIWLSEGFATYLTDLYVEYEHGRDAFVASMLDEKGQVLRFARRRLAPIVDTTLPVSIRLLNKNSYEKAGWVLHMLRHQLGDELFHQCIRVFYSKFKYANALTEDFQEVVESLSGRNFDSFFLQWFYQPGHPVLSSIMEYKNKEIRLTIRQHQEQHTFFFPLDVKISDDQGNVFSTTLAIDSHEQVFTFDSAWKPAQIILDPETWLLFEHHHAP